MIIPNVPPPLSPPEMNKTECDLRFYEGDCGVLSLWAPKDNSVAYVKLFADTISAADEAEAIGLLCHDNAEYLKGLQPGWGSTNTTFTATTLKAALCGGLAGWLSYRGGIH